VIKAADRRDHEKRLEKNARRDHAPAAFVIPGRRKANPESITTNRNYGFRVRAHSASQTGVNALKGARAPE
jgi:hypothetical protein